MTAFGYETYFSDLRARYRIPPECVPVRGIPAVGEKDDLPLRRRLNAVVPVSFAETDGFLFACAYPAFRDILSRFLERYARDPFSDEALGQLHLWMREPLADYGYAEDRFYSRWAVSCLCEDPGKVPKDILPGLRLLTPDDDGTLGNRTTMKLSDCIARTAAAVIRDGCVVSIASVNSANGPGACRELGVETAVGFRGRGFAGGVTALLTKTLTERGEVPLYQYYRTNIPSAHTAAHAGLTPVGRFFSYTSFRK